MRTTLTIDDRIAKALKDLARRSNLPFKDVVNDILRAGLTAKGTRNAKPYLVRPPALGGPMPGINLDKALALTPDRKVDDKGVAFGQVGVGATAPEWPPEMLREQHFNVFTAVMPALNQTWETTAFTLVSIKKMLTGLISHKNLSGPVTIAKVASASAKTGWESYVSFLALLSISLGVLNLLPVPVLDGGHLLFYAIEAVRGSPLPDRIQNFGTQIGLGLVLMMMVLALLNDFSRL